MAMWYVILFLIFHLQVIGKTKLFIRHPETFYALEEMRERKFHESASRIAHAFRSFKLRKYYSNLNDQAYQLLSSKKERRRKSINRAFIGDYIDFGKKNILRYETG